MADAPKKDSPKKDAPKKSNAMRDLAIVIIVVVILYISQNITPLTPSGLSSGDTSGNILAFLQNRFDFVALQNYLLSLGNILGVLGIVLLAGVFLLAIRLMEINKEDRKKYEPIITEEVQAKALLGEWQVVLDHVNSESPAEWKLAILEADSMLDEILDSEGYVGETLGEKLKAMSPSAISSYNDLWEAHKMRNEIAHEGSSVELTKRAARDTINKFEVAFRELGHI